MGNGGQFVMTSLTRLMQTLLAGSWDLLVPPATEQAQVLGKEQPSGNLPDVFNIMHLYIIM